MIYQGKARHKVGEVVLHCAAINTGQFDGMTPLNVFTEINRWHRERGFKGFGYHGLIMPNGQYYSGRPFSEIGAHVIGHNQGTLGILLIESRKIKELGCWADYYTRAQAATLKALLEGWRTNHGIEKVSGHNDYANKVCPGFQVGVGQWLPET